MQQPHIHPYYLHVEQNLQALWDHQQQLKKQLEDQVLAIQLENNQLKERLDQIKTISIENINYKIQELTVQQLSGTLNIGLSALTDPEEIKKWLNIDEVTIEDNHESQASQDNQDSQDSQDNQANKHNPHIDPTIDPPM